MAPYSTKNDVKDRLGLPTSNTDHDTTLDNFIEAADRRIDEAIAPFAAVPLVTVPALIKHISADLAAAAFAGRPMGNLSDESRAWAESLETKAMKQLDEYLTNNYGRAYIAVPALEDSGPT